MNLTQDIKLDVSEEAVVVEIDGVRGEVTLGQAREVREMLAEYAIQCIQQTTRQRRAELRMLEASSNQQAADEGLARSFVEGKAQSIAGYGRR